MTVQWSGSDTGTAALDATASRCDGGELRIFAVAGDTGVGLRLRPPDDGGAGMELPVMAVSDFDQTRPSAAVGARWLDSVSVNGYRGVDGTVRLADADAEQLDGELDVTLRQDGGEQVVRLSGTFSRVPLTPCDSGTIRLPE